MRKFLFVLFVAGCSCLAFAKDGANNGRSENGSGRLTKKEAEAESQRLWQACLRDLSAGLKNEWDAKEIRAGSKVLRLKVKVSGGKPVDGRSLYISMHGGGNATKELNDQQWNNQIRLYSPKEGVYVAPRAPTNTWNLWHEAHIDTLFDRLIEAAVALEGVNPNKVYLMGYSAGGDGVYQLAPRMADRWAAAAMMAGHPNEASPRNLRNIGFAIHMGALDSAYNRNEIARKWGLVLDSLRKADPQGYQHVVQLHEGRGHWMNREDSVAVPWMASFRRNPLPDRVVWKQDDVNHYSFYWLAVPVESAKTGGEVVVSRTGNVLNVEKNYSDTLIIRLNDKMMDLDKPLTVRYLGREIYKGKVQRLRQVIERTIQERKDRDLIFSSELVIVKGRVIKS